MKYDITKPKAPKMPTLGKGTECIKILLSQASKDMYEPLVPMFFTVLGAHMSGAEFQYPDLTWKETCGQMANLVSESGGNKGQLSLLVEAERGTCHSSSRPKGALGSISVAEAERGTWLHFSRRVICRDFRAHDDEELKKLVEWQRQVKTKSANKEKPAGGPVNHVIARNRTPSSAIARTPRKKGVSLHCDSAEQEFFDTTEKQNINATSVTPSPYLLPAAQGAAGSRQGGCREGVGRRQGRGDDETSSQRVEESKSRRVDEVKGEINAIKN